MAIYGNSGRTAAAEALKAKTIHLAWGTGDPVWDTTPADPSVDQVALLNEVGRRSAVQTLYVTPDEAGEISLPGGANFSVSADPTKYLYSRFLFDYQDGAGEMIRETAIFVGTVIKTGLPAGQSYFFPTDIDSPGRLMVVENISRLDRTLPRRQQFEFVIQF